MGNCDLGLTKKEVSEMMPRWEIDQAVNTDSIPQDLRPDIEDNLILIVMSSTQRGWYMLVDESRERVFEWCPGEGDRPIGLEEDLD